MSRKRMSPDDEVKFEKYRKTRSREPIPTQKVVQDKKKKWQREACREKF